MPFFSGLISKLRPVYTFKVETQATDGYNLFINPQFTYNLDMTEKAFVLAHEVMHCVLNHMRRGKDHDSFKSNIAADYEVNCWINDVGLIKASVQQKIGAYYDAKYSGWGYEKIYADNPKAKNSNNMDNSGESKDAQKNQQNSQQNQQGGNSSGNNSGGQNKKNYSDEYKKGWAQAMEDYKNGKIKL